jgi:signal transduction histidine kinase
MPTRRRRLANWWLDRPLRSKGLAVLAPPVLVLVITVAASFIVGRYQAALRSSATAAAQSARLAATNSLHAQNPDYQDTLRSIQGYQNTVIEKNHDADQLQSVIETIQITGLLVGVIGGFVAMVLFVRSIVRRIGEVDANARRLGVSEPLLPIPPAQDEVGHLAQELRQTSELLTERSTDLVRAHGAAVDSADTANQLLSRVSHELRTPLTAVMGFGQMIDQSNLNEEDAEAVEQILHGGTHMLRIIEEAKITTTRTPRAIDVDLYPVEVGPVVDEVQTLLSPLSASRHLTVTAGQNCGVAVMADYHRFKQVLINLMSNAVKYNRDGGRITISCGPPAEGTAAETGAAAVENGKVRIAVTDTGDGIPADMIDRVFVPFDRLDAAERGVEGTGIGLSLSRTFVEAMDGTIGVESKVGVGSTFWVELPLAAPPQLRPGETRPPGRLTASPEPGP